MVLRLLKFYNGYNSKISKEIQTPVDKKSTGVYFVSCKGYNMRNRNIVLKNIISQTLKNMRFINKERKNIVYAMFEMLLLSNKCFKIGAIDISYYKAIRNRINKMVLTLWSKDSNVNKLLSLIDLIYRS